MVNVRSRVLGALAITRTTCAAYIWPTPGGGMTVLRFSTGRMDSRLGPSFNPKWGRLSSSSLVCIFCQGKFAAFPPRSVLGCKSGSSVAGDLCSGGVCFPRSSDSLSMSYDHTLVHVRRIMVKWGASRATSQEIVCSPGMSNDQEAYKHTHTYAHTHWGCAMFDEL